MISIRAYDDSCSYHNKDKYHGIVTGWALTDTEMYLHSAHGNVGPKVIKQVFKKLKEMGFEAVMMSRHGKRKRHIL